MFSSFFRQKTYDAADVDVMEIINSGLTDLQLQLQLQSTRLDEVRFFIAPYLLVEKHFYTPDPNNLFFELNKYIHRVFERENSSDKQRLLEFNKYCIEAISIAFNNAMEKNRKKKQYKDNNPPLGFYLFMLVFTFTLLQYEMKFNTPNTTLRMINNSTIINFNDMLLGLLSSNSQLTIEILLNTLKMAADPTAAEAAAAEAAAAAAVVVDPAAAAAAAEAEAAREIEAAKKKIESMASKIKAAEATIKEIDDLHALRAAKKATADAIDAEHAGIVLTRNESTIPSSTRYALDRLYAAQAAIKKGGNNRKSKKTNSRKKKRVPITRRRRVKSIKYKKNVV